jgi:hypothetical protein
MTDHILIEVSLRGHVSAGLIARALHAGVGARADEIGAIRAAGGGVLVRVASGLAQRLRAPQSLVLREGERAVVVRMRDAHAPPWPSPGWQWAVAELEAGAWPRPGALAEALAQVLPVSAAELGPVYPAGADLRIALPRHRVAPGTQAVRFGGADFSAVLRLEASGPVNTLGPAAAAWLEVAEHGNDTLDTWISAMSRETLAQTLKEIAAAVEKKNTAEPLPEPLPTREELAAYSVMTEEDAHREWVAALEQTRGVVSLWAAMERAGRWAAVHQCQPAWLTSAHRGLPSAAAAWLVSEGPAATAGESAPAECLRRWRARRFAPALLRTELPTALAPPDLAECWAQLPAKTIEKHLGRMELLVDPAGALAFQTRAAAVAKQLRVAHGAEGIAAPLLEVLRQAGCEGLWLRAGGRHLVGLGGLLERYPELAPLGPELISAQGPAGESAGDRAYRAWLRGDRRTAEQLTAQLDHTLTSAGAPGWVDGYFLRAELAMQQRDITGARRWLAQAQRACPDRPDAAWVRAHYEAHEGNDSSAIEALGEPRHAWARALLGRLHYRGGNPQAARAQGHAPLARPWPELELPDEPALARLWSPASDDAIVWERLGFAERAARVRLAQFAASSLELWELVRLAAATHSGIVEIDATTGRRMARALLVDSDAAMPGAVGERPVLGAQWAEHLWARHHERDLARRARHVRRELLDSAIESGFGGAALVKSLVSFGAERVASGDPGWWQQRWPAVSRLLHATPLEPTLLVELARKSAKLPRATLSRALRVVLDAQPSSAELEDAAVEAFVWLSAPEETTAPDAAVAPEADPAWLAHAASRRASLAEQRAGHGDWDDAAAIAAALLRRTSSDATRARALTVLALTCASSAAPNARAAATATASLLKELDDTRDQRVWPAVSAAARAAVPEVVGAALKLSSSEPTTWAGWLARAQLLGAAWALGLGPKRGRRFELEPWIATGRLEHPVLLAAAISAALHIHAARGSAPVGAAPWVRMVEVSDTPALFAFGEECAARANAAPEGLGGLAPHVPESL